ncbi:unnamed protein product, partial [Phaeothamnion confervicola]
GNGNVRTLACNTTGTSSFGATNPDMDVLEVPEGKQCQVTSESDGALLGGTMKLGMTYPHWKEGTPLLYNSTEISWRATAAAFTKALAEAVDAYGNLAFGDVVVTRAAHWPFGEQKWSGQYNWSITFDDRPGDVPPIAVSDDALVTNLDNSGSAAVSTMRDGAEINGSFGLTYCEPLDAADCTASNATAFLSYLTADEMRYALGGEFFGLGVAEVNVTTGDDVAWLDPATYDGYNSVGNSSHGGVEVSHWVLLDGVYYTVEGVAEIATSGLMAITLDANVTTATGMTWLAYGVAAVSVSRTGPTQAMGYTWDITFSNKTVGGDQQLLTADGTLLFGSGVDLAVSEIQAGNQLTGTFTLSYGGKTTAEIPFDADAAVVETALSLLASVYPSRVVVTRTAAMVDDMQQVQGYTWTVTFNSATWHDPTDHSVALGYVSGNWYGVAAAWDNTWESTGEGRFSKAWGKNVGVIQAMECSSDGLGTTRNDGGEGCAVAMVRQGTDPLGGTFSIGLDTRGSDVIAAKEVCVARGIPHNAWATAAESGGDGTSMEEKLEALDCIGDVTVTRSDVALGGPNGGYAWLVTFLRDQDLPCQEKSDSDGLCNSPGDVPKFNSTLTDASGLLGTSYRNNASEIARGVVTLLDVSDGNDTAPGTPEVQEIRVYDLAYSASDRFEANPQFVLYFD